MWALRLSRRKAGRNGEFIGDGLALFFSGKLLSNGSIKPDASPLGHRRFISNKSEQANLIKKRFGHWLTNGAESFGGVGNPIQLMTKRNT